MPGIYYAGPEGGQTYAPDIRPYLLANSLTGAGTPPANAIQFGDLVCLTQATALTSGGNTVVRPLLAADVTAVYKEGTPIAGVLGIAMDSVQSNSVGAPAGGPPPLGGITTAAAIPYPYAYAGMQPVDDATGRGQLSVVVFRPGQVFIGTLYVGGGTVTLQHQYDDTLAGFHLTTVSGITTFTVDTGATTKILRILGPVTQDPNYNKASGTVQTGAPSVYFELLGSYSQAETGVVYSTQ